LRKHTETSWSERMGNCTALNYVDREYAALFHNILTLSCLCNAIWIAHSVWRGVRPSLCNLPNVDYGTAQLFTTYCEGVCRFLQKIWATAWNQTLMARLATSFSQNDFRSWRRDLLTYLTVIWPNLLLMGII
jgi:hypothetical protein